MCGCGESYEVWVDRKLRLDLAERRLKESNWYLDRHANEYDPATNDEHNEAVAFLDKLKHGGKAWDLTGHPLVDAGLARAALRGKA